MFRISDEGVSNLFGRREHTAGRVFWYKKRLHIIFGGIRNTVKKQTLYGQAQTAKLAGEPEEGARSDETDLDFKLVKAPGVAYASKKRRDWFVIHPEKTRTPRSAAQSGDRGDIEARLRKLNRLLDRGLIDKREYRARKRELLDEL